MGSFCDGSIFFFRSDYLVTDLVTIIIHRKRSLVFYKQSSQRDVEESTGLGQSDSKEKKKHGHIQSLPEYRVTRYESVLLQSNPTTIVLLLLVQCYKNRQYTQVYIHQLVILHSRKIGNFLRKAFPAHITYRVYVQYMHAPQQAKNPEKRPFREALLFKKG